MTTDLQGRTALVTGATSGIGRAIALALAARGAHVIVSGRDADRGAAAVNAITAGGGSADFLAADLSTTEGAHGLAKAATDGGRMVDILVNNAGIFPYAPTADTSDADLHAVYATNVLAPFVLVGELAPLMAERGHGTVINITSGAVTQPSGQGQALYGSSKASLDYLTRAWAAEFGPSGVRVNAVSPGIIRTEGTAPLGATLDQMTSSLAAGRVGDPEEVSAMCVFLASNEASYIYGAVIPVDGGVSVA